MGEAGASLDGTTRPRTSGKAIASLVLGIAGILVLPVIASALAIIFGISARNEIRHDSDRSGEGIATAGLWLGVAGPVLIVLLFLLFV